MRDERVQLHILVQRDRVGEIRRECRPLRTGEHRRARHRGASGDGVDGGDLARVPRRERLSDHVPVAEIRADLRLVRNGDRAEADETILQRAAIDGRVPPDIALIERICVQCELDAAVVDLARIDEWIARERE